MVDILKNENGRQIVKLSENYAYGTHVTTAALAENVILIDVLRSGKKSKRFTITSDEMNALTEAWTQFKHTQEVAKELEQQRIDGLAEAARKRIEEMGATAITIEDNEATKGWHHIIYIHNQQWNDYIHTDRLDEHLTRLLNHIEQENYPLTVEGIPPDRKPFTAFKVTLSNAPFSSEEAS